MSDTESSLIQRAKKGDQEAFAALVTEHQRFVYNLVLRVLKDENEALDLAQETFIRAWTALPNFREQSKFRTWLYRIVTNLCYNRLPGLRQSLQEMGAEIVEEMSDKSSGITNPARKLESKELRKHLHKAVEELDEHYRLLITMRYQDELSYKEIASTLNLPLGTVKTGLFRAKERLRKAYEAYEEAVWTTA